MAGQRAGRFPFSLGCCVVGIIGICVSGVPIERSYPTGKHSGGATAVDDRRATSPNVPVRGAIATYFSRGGHSCGIAEMNCTLPSDRGRGAGCEYK